MMTKILFRNYEMRKNGFKKDLPALPPREPVFMFILLVSNHTVYLVQFGMPF